MIEEQGLFMTRQASSEEVKRFLTENPQAKWTEALDFLVKNFPQSISEQVTWILEGGAGVYLLKPKQRPEPDDLDILTRTDGLAEQFANSHLFDAKSIKTWLTTRGLPYSTELETYILSSPYEAAFQEMKILVMNPIILSASKQMPYTMRPSRPKDLKDIQLLGVPAQQIQTAIHRLQKVPAG